MQDIQRSVAKLNQLYEFFDWCNLQVVGEFDKGSAAMCHNRKGMVDELTNGLIDGHAWPILTSLATAISIGGKTAVKLTSFSIPYSCIVDQMSAPLTKYSIAHDVRVWQWKQVLLKLINHFIMHRPASTQELQPRNYCINIPRTF